MNLPIESTPEIETLLHEGAPVCIGVSGGKDSCAAAFATNDYLDSVGHRGPRVLVHSDLGRIEWRDSLPTCERLATALGLELIVVRRAAGDMMDRFLVRWDNNVARYAALECVKLILPWSTPSMRFCTSELKTAVICRELIRRFPGQTILSVSGIRRDESTGRSKAPTAKEQSKLTSITHGTRGLDWHPIAGWLKDDIFSYLEEKSFPLHEAYVIYGTSRVSCSFCIMSSKGDMAASASCPDNHDVYREMVELEARSTFSFQENTWLGDVSPMLLSTELSIRLDRAKEKAKEREDAESLIPSHLLYTKGWPTCVPTVAEAKLLCTVRKRVAAAVGLEIDYTEPEELRERYRGLMAQNAQKEEAKDQKEKRKLLRAA
jgi:3'-phosphoadenosine 5'-phosphosulfate sulfotransferase (PAPS reductase)/FAD synthetase